MPAWIFIILIALAEIVLGFVLFLVLRKMILTKSVESASTYQPALLEEPASPN